MPETGREAHHEAFVADAYALFNDTLYEDVAAGETGDGVFNFQEDDSEAPHAAPAISWDRKLMEFNPSEVSSAFNQEDLIRLVYGNFLECISQRIGFDSSTQP